LALSLLALVSSSVAGGVITTHPYSGITYITRTETSPRSETMHIVLVDLTDSGGAQDTVRQTTLDCLNQQQAQVAVNVHFFVPFPSDDANANVVGLAASYGNVDSAFEPQPVATGFVNQSYAIVPFGAALNIDADNHASIVHRDPAYNDNKHVLEPVSLYNSLSGSAQIVTDGVVTVPLYKDAGHPDGLLTPNGTYSNSYSWYSLANARTCIGLSQDGNTLVLFTVDNAGGSHGMTPGEIANLLVWDYGVYNALNLDSGGSTTLAMADPDTGIGAIMNASADNPLGRAVGSNLVVFADSVPEPVTLTLLAAGGLWLLRRRRVAQSLAAAVLALACLAGPAAQAAVIPYSQDFEGAVAGFNTASTGTGTYTFSVVDQGGNNVYRHSENRTGGGSPWLMSSIQVSGLSAKEDFQVSSLATPVQTIAGVNCTAGIRFLTPTTPPTTTPT
jgi:hypothetical protein